ncbi:hypothetical protein GCM10023193_61310 [Planotetraspora kaengkrachanensis]|uniref:Uncharacterized protein n=1 Tax=Planotetraspora kaengkrachanensis TaxID=575193 RepID=A0A8J3V987_9ACTN|nr:hypothetical protein Pka01_56990 [Planotetraspora kaengkrachanensis]
MQSSTATTPVANVLRALKDGRYQAGMSSPERVIAHLLLVKETAQFDNNVPK